jgi:hypothetical protein
MLKRSRREKHGAVRVEPQGEIQLEVAQEAFLVVLLGPLDHPELVNQVRRRGEGKPGGALLDDLPIDPLPILAENEFAAQFNAVRQVDRARPQDDVCHA